MSKRILHLVIKNTSSLDFVLPFFWKLRRMDTEYELFVLYCTFDRKNILRNTFFYSEIFSEIGVKEYDFLDFVKAPFKIFAKVLRLLLFSSYTDKRSVFEIKENLKKGRLRVVWDLLLLIYYKIVYFIGEKFVDFDSIMSFFDPDVIFLDNRARSDFPGRDVIFRYMYETKKKVVLIPHAPHFRDPVSEFCPFDEKGEQLPSFCEHWSPMKGGEPWKALGLKEPDDRFVYSGYPGFDEDWLRFCRMRIKKSDNVKRVLFIVRRFLDKGIKRPNGLDYYILDFEDFYDPLLAIKEVMEEFDGDVKLIVKAHPSNNHNKLVSLMKESGIRHWEVTYEPIYALLGSIDVVVSLPSTVLLVPAITGIPTILVRNKLQDQIEARWEKLRFLYRDCAIIANNLDELKRSLRKHLERKSEMMDARKSALDYYDLSIDADSLLKRFNGRMGAYEKSRA